MISLKEKLERKKNRIGLVGTRLNFSRPQSGKGIEEYITHDWREVVVKIREDINLVPDEETKRYLQKVCSGDDPVEIVATDLLYHGCGHRELPINTGLGCPFTVEHHDQIKDGVARALKEKGKEGLESYVSNAFEDIFDNLNARQHTRHAGQILFWNNEGFESHGVYPAFYEAFVKTNLQLWGSPEDVTLLKRFFTNTEEVKKAVAEFKNYLKSYLGTRSLVALYQKEDLFKQLFQNKKHWKEIAYRFTLATADLLEQNPTMRMCFGTNPDGEMPFDHDIKLPEVQEGLAYERYKAGDGPSKHTDPLLQLDALYRRISRSIAVKTSSYTKAQGIPLTSYGKRNLHEEETVKIRRMKGVGFNEEGELTLKMGRHELQHPAHYKVHPRNFPKLKIALIDRSISMEDSPDNTRNSGDTSFIPWGDNSKYHFALKGIYGIDNFLEKQGIAPYVQSEVVTFSSATQRTRRGAFRNEQERYALLRRPSGGTHLDPAVVKAAMAEKSFLISLSDGDISNWGTVRDSFREAITGADYCHIQIGSPNQFTQDLESWGIPVKYVRGDNDLSNLLVDLTATYYKGGSFA